MQWSVSQSLLKQKRQTLLVLRQTEVAVPAWDEYHVIPKIFPLNLGLLEHDNVCLEDVEHALGVQ